jgi:hypothetical protein
MRQDMPGETLEGGTTRAARVHDRRDARYIGIYPEPGEPFENVSVEINQTGRDNQAIRLDDASRLLARNRRRDARNRSLLDRYIVNAAETGKMFSEF